VTLKFAFCVSASALSLILASASARAQSVNDENHGDHDGTKEIVVTGILARNQADILSGTSIVSGDDLARELRPTIGETLSRQAGVSATSFGPNASRPVLRGFQGERVRILSDGIGSFDVSNTSVDHAVVINPLTADRIEVLRGPAAMLYGSSAIGGVVNVIDSRIPRSIPDENVHVDGIATYGSAAEERSTSARVDVPLSDKIIVHLDGSFLKTADQNVGGFVLTPALRAAAQANGNANVANLAILEGTLPNSAARTWEVAGGAAVITSNGNLGFSVSHYDSLYGLPIRYSVDPTAAAEAVRLDVAQTRVDLRGEVNPASGFLEAIRLRGGFADYRHDELDEAGNIGTTFANQGWEGRLEVVQRPHGGWKGAIGGQFFLRNLNIIGAEKFLPKSETQQYGLFTVQSFDFGLVRAEAGGRIERSILSAKADVDLGNGDLRRQFTALSGSLGASIEFAKGWRLGLNGSYTERAPSAEELFSNGPHAGTQSFEIGSPEFGKESSKGIEATVRGKGDGYSVSASLYYSDFDGFIFERPTGAIEDGLPVFQFAQAGARHYGIEVEASARLARIGSFTINIDGVGDFTRAKLKSGGSLPRIPALRLLGGLEAQSDTLTGRVEVEWVDGQNRIAAFETATPDYTMTNASINWKPIGPDSPVSLSLSANNIFNVEARRHASFLKDYAPLSGRDIRISARFSL
jgi:iron complex outermembrane recepter protein